MRTPASVAIAGVLWFGVALSLTVSGTLTRLAPPGPQLLGAAATAGLLVSGALAPRLRSWISDLDLRAVVSLHLTRYVGGYFLWLYSEGRLPYGFAVPAGVGDLIVASGATALLVVGDLRRRSSALAVWNAFGLLDILLVVAAAARAGMADRASMVELLELPLGLLPTFLVPLIIASHVLVFCRLRAAK